MSGPVGSAYQELVRAGELKADPAQERAVTSLDRLAADMQNGRPGLLGKLFGKPRPSLAGVYLWGGVGRGKSMLMDLAFDHIDVNPKRRVHFHAFMLEMHARLRDKRKDEEGDPLERVAEDVGDEVKLLCFDEMVVNNPADAMILSRLFEHLHERGVRVVTTSNRPPRDLYKDGLNRELFLPFIELIEQRFDVVEINGPTDYRLHRLSGVNVWHVPKSLKGVAVFSFKRLCGEPRGAADYLAIAQRFHTVFLVGIPVMTEAMRNEAARFVTLIDALYEHRVKLLAAADAEPAALYPAGDGSFEFARTASRLEEMRSADYLAAGHGAA